VKQQSTDGQDAAPHELPKKQILILQKEQSILTLFTFNQWFPTWMPRHPRVPFTKVTGSARKDVFQCIIKNTVFKVSSVGQVFVAVKK